MVCAEAFALGRHGIAGLIGQTSPLGYLTSRFWSPSVLWSIDLVIVLAGLSFLVASVNAAIRIMYTMGRERALPGSADCHTAGPRWPFISLGWLLIGAIVAGILRARRPATYQALGGAVAPNLDTQLEPD